MPGDDGVETTKNEAIAAQINSIRRLVKDTLPPFFKRIKAAKTGRDAAAILYQFLETSGVKDQLISWRDAYLDQGDLAKADQPEQTWTTFCDMLDEYVAILGDRAFNLDEFLALLQAGFEGATFSQIPSTLDQVTVSESGMVQMNNRKVTFMIGSTDDVMPDVTVANRLLSDEDREKIQLPDDKFLGETNSATLNNEPFLNYLAFVSGSERLIFTYSTNGDEEEKRQLSPYVARIAQHFGIEIQNHAAVPDPADNEIWHYLGAKRATLRHLVQVSDASRTSEVALAPAWQYVYQTLIQDSNYHSLTEHLLGGMSYRNEPKSLVPEIVDALYGKTIYTSISKLEEFYSNQYAYFLKYGLKLQERPVFELSPASTGEFFHAAMDMLVKMLRDQRLDLAELDDSQLHELVDEIVTKILDDPANLQFAILKSSNRMAYIAGQLIATVRRMATTLHQQSQRTPMRPTQTEVLFGHVAAKTGLDPIAFALPGARKVEVRGKIDRIDQMQVDGKTYLGVVDYKSSVHDFNLSDAYQGTAMQMMTYLDAVKRNLATIAGTENAELAGALYLHLSNPKLSFKDIFKLATDDDFLEPCWRKKSIRGSWLMIQPD
ncbi:PD-(D/E)XK nuclease family protein [Secundilactobacillus oryzae]|uniref:PD-(D/E)XK nuclease family protein n=1 Tax=Secundilactobacillus oryzae TaxID=1202668 RepID=UPI002092129C|nr:PD-(D/E)XK nuclease family protein [Secundilactobacillus oryzae]